MTYHQAVAILRGPQYAARNPRLWDKTQGAFVPVL